MAHNYRMAAFDMDGTLLDSEHRITQGVQDAMARAAAAGKVLVLSTGRNLAELREYLEILPQVRYINSISGAMAMDLVTGRTIYAETIPQDIVTRLMTLTEDLDTNLQILTTRSYVERQFLGRLSLYGMGTYQRQFEANATLVEDIRAFYRNEPFPVYKMNLYHRSAAAREITRERIVRAGIRLTMANAEGASIECSPHDVNKAVGLRAIAKYLGISMEDVIVVGDADNDRAALLAAGLPIAMGNASPEIKAICKVVTADCNHDGCRSVIEQYLLV